MCMYWIACSSEFKCTYNRNSILSFACSLPRCVVIAVVATNVVLYRSYFSPLYQVILFLSLCLPLWLWLCPASRYQRALTHTPASQPVSLWWRKIYTSDKALWNGVCVNWSEISVHRTTSLSHSKFYCTCGKTNLMLDLLVNKWEVDKTKNIYNNSNNNGNHDYHHFWTRASARWLFCCVSVCTHFYVFYVFMCERVDFVYLSARSRVHSCICVRMRVTANTDYGYN